MRSESIPAAALLLRLSLAGTLGLSLVLITLVSSTNVTAQALSGDRDSVRRVIRDATKLARKDSLGSAEKAYREALVTAPDSPELKVELALTLAKQRKLVEAAKLAFDVCQADPNNARAFAVLGTVLLNAGRFDDARPILLNSIKLDRNQDLAWAGIGMLDFYENRIDISIRNLEEAVFRRNDDPDYWFAYAQVSARAEKYKQAADAYEQFLSTSASTDRERRDRIKGLIQFLRYIGNKDTLYASVGSPQTTVDFQLEGNRPIISLRLNNNSEPLRFVLDTGSGITVISEATAQRLKIKPINRGGFAKGIGGDGRFEIVYGFLRSMEIGDVAVRNVPVYIRKFHDDLGNIDGYIGLAVISKYLTTIDYGSKTFILSKKTDPVPVADPTSLSLPLRLTSSGFLSGQVNIEGIETMLNFIVDTGASVSVISDRVAANVAIMPFANDEKLRVIGSAGITDGVPTFLLPRVTFGQHTRKKVMAIALDLDIINEATGFEQAGILGGNFLKNYRMTFDFKNSKVNFTSINPENQ